MNIFEDAIAAVSSAGGKKGEGMKVNCNKVVEANKGLVLIKKIRNVLEGKSEENIPKLSPADIASFKHAPLTFVEVERTFSKLKHLLSDRRLSFTAENMKKMIIASCNQMG